MRPPGKRCCHFSLNCSGVDFKSVKDLAAVAAIHEAWYTTTADRFLCIKVLARAICLLLRFLFVILARVIEVATSRCGMVMTFIAHAPQSTQGVRTKSLSRLKYKLFD
jgi:hypothetical protein